MNARSKALATPFIAAIEGESALLRDLYLRGVGRDEHPDGQGERLHPSLPIYGNRDAWILAYWDHEPRASWQTPAYYAAQRRSLRPSTYLRLRENRWTSGESVFITPSLWDANVDCEIRPLLPTKEVQLCLGVDAAIKNDGAAVVGVVRDGDRVQLATHRIWKPTPREPLDLEATIEAYLRSLAQQYPVVEILYDPFQLHRSMTTLRTTAGLPVREFPQTSANLTVMGQALFDLLNGKNLRLYRADDLREQALHTIAIESPRGWRIASEVLPLEWRHIDLQAGEVRLDPGSTRNREGRVFPFTDDLRTLLEAQHREHVRLKKAGHIVPWVFWRLVANGRGGDKEPKPIRSFGKGWKAACLAAGCPGRIPHDFRRTAVRNMVRRGVPERVDGAQDAERV